MESLTLFPLAVISEQVSFLPTATCHFFPLFIVVVVLLFCVFYLSFIYRDSVLFLCNPLLIVPMYVVLVAPASKLISPCETIKY